MSKYEEIAKQLSRAMREVAPVLNNMQQKTITYIQSLSPEKLAIAGQNSQQTQVKQNLIFKAYATLLEEPLKKHLAPEYHNKIQFSHGCVYMQNVSLKNASPQSVNIFAYGHMFVIINAHTQEMVQQTATNKDLENTFAEIPQNLFPKEYFPEYYV